MVAKMVSWRRSFEQLMHSDDFCCHVFVTTRVASWTIDSLLSAPRRPKLSTARVVSLYLRSTKDTCVERA